MDDIELEKQTAFNTELISIFNKHWVGADRTTQACMFHALCIALATSILLITGENEQEIDEAVILAEQYIRGNASELLATSKARRQ